MSCRELCRVLFVAFFAFAATFSTASAQDEVARVHFSAGASYYARGDYTRALEEFELARALSGRGQLLFNISLCHQQLGDLPRAADALAEYLEQVRDIPDRVTMEARLENLRARIRAREASSDETVPPEPVQVDVASPPEPEVPRRPPPAWTWIGFGVAGAGVTIAATFGGLALANRASIEEGCGALRACTDEDVATMDRLALASDVGLAVTVVGTAVGIVGLVLPRGPGDEDDVSALVLPVVDPRRGFVGATVGGRF